MSICAYFSRLHSRTRRPKKQPKLAYQQQNLPFWRTYSNHLNEINFSFLFVSYFLSIRRLVRRVFFLVLFRCFLRIRSACFRTVCSLNSASRFPHFLMYLIYHLERFPVKSAQRRKARFVENAGLLCQQIPQNALGAGQKPVCRRRARRPAVAMPGSTSWKGRACDTAESTRQLPQRVPMNAGHSPEVVLAVRQAGHKHTANPHRLAHRSAFAPSQGCSRVRSGHALAAASRPSP